MIKIYKYIIFLFFLTLPFAFSEGYVIPPEKGAQKLEVNTAQYAINNDKFIYYINGLVTNVYDGDTIIVKDFADEYSYTIRLIRIDAPELAQNYGKEAKEKLTQKILGKEVVVSLRGKDMFRRFLGKVYSIDGENINLLQVKNGYAWFFPFNDQNSEDDDAYKAAETEARNNKIGLWSEKNPLNPRDFRKLNRKNK